MSKFELFWTILATFLTGCLVIFLCFVTYCYYDCAVNMREVTKELCLKNKHIRQRTPLNIDQDDWIEFKADFI